MEPTSRAVLRAGLALAARCAPTEPFARPEIRSLARPRSVPFYAIARPPAQTTFFDALHARRKRLRIHCLLSVGFEPYNLHSAARRTEEQFLGGEAHLPGLHACGKFRNPLVARDVLQLQNRNRTAGHHRMRRVRRTRCAHLQHQRAATIRRIEVELVLADLIRIGDPVFVLLDPLGGALLDMDERGQEGVRPEVCQLVGQLVGVFVLHVGRTAYAVGAGIEPLLHPHHAYARLDLVGEDGALDRCRSSP